MWWTWCIAGLVLLALEMVQPGGFFLFFLGLGAIGTGIVVAAFGGSFEAWIPWALFSLLSITFLVLFRAKARQFLARGATPRAPELTGESAVVLERNIAPNGSGIVELRGTQWQAKNVGDAELALGARVRVIAVHGLTVNVVAE